MSLLSQTPQSSPFPSRGGITCDFGPPARTSALSPPSPLRGGTEGGGAATTPRSAAGWTLSTPTPTLPSRGRERPRVPPPAPPTHRSIPAQARPCPVARSSVLTPPSPLRGGTEGGGAATTPRSAAGWTLSTPTPTLPSRGREQPRVLPPAPPTHWAIPAQAEIQLSAGEEVSVGLAAAAFPTHGVIPAQAGIHSEDHPRHPACGDGSAWIPACAGMTPRYLKVQ